MSRIASTVALIAASSLLSPPQLSYSAPQAPAQATPKPSVSTTAKPKTKAKPPSTISAQELSYEEIEYEKGVTFFKAGDYERAVVAFVKVHRVAPNPNLIYNIARCFEELKRFDEAADSYEEYLKLNPKASDSAQILVTIKTLRSLARTQKAKEQAKAEPPQPKSAPSVTVEAEGPAPSSDSMMSAVSWLSVGVGGLLLVGGGLSGLEAVDADERRQAAKAAKNNAAYNQAQSDMRSAAVRTDLLLISGAVLTTTGVILLLSSGSDEEAPAASESVQLSLSPRYVGLSWQF